MSLKSIQRFRVSLLVASALVLALTGCGTAPDSTGSFDSSSTAIVETTVSSDEEETVSSDGEETASVSSDEGDATSPSVGIDTTDSSVLLSLKWNGETAYVAVGDGVPDFTEEELTLTEAFESYSELDELGRAGVAFALLGSETMPEDGDERGDISEVYPTGWVQACYEDLIDNGGWLYNRCHLIAWALSDEDANEENLITGTRYLNTEGMLDIEEQVLEYIEATSNHVLYRVTPVYDGNNLLASGVRIEAWSVEDGGQGICLDVYCFNVQPGVEIDYTTGESELA